MLKLIYSTIFILLATMCFAQETDTTARQQSAKSTEIPFFDDRLFNGIRFGIDVAGIAYGYMVNSDFYTIENKYEINGDFGIKRWFANLDLGTATFMRNYPDQLPTSSTYNSTGQYFRIGADYRISKSAKSFLFFGGRFGKAFFTEKAEIEIPGILVDGVQARPPAQGWINRQLSANWLEMNTGVKTHIWKNFYLGYTLRFKVLLAGKKIKEEEPLDVPGFGVANRNNNVGLTFHIMYRIPFGKDPEVPLKGR